MSVVKSITENKDRIITGLALVALFSIVSIINHKFLWWLVMGIMYAAAFREASKLFDAENVYMTVGAGVLWFVAYFYPRPVDLLFLSALVFASVMAYGKRGEWKLFLPFLYPTVGFLFLLILYTEEKLIALFWLVLIVVATDVGAYIVGKSMGKTPFSPSSPNKTLEGVVGGVVIATLLGFIPGVVLVDIKTALLFSFLVSVASIFGDLFESQLKRAAGVKDSGNILPGHGGVLDRMDGYLFASVMLVVLLRSYS